MRVGFLPLCLLAVIGSASGCSSESEGSSTTNVPVTEIPQRFADAACDALTACYGPETQWLLGGEQCVTRLKNQLDDGLTTIQSAIDSGKVKYDGTKLEACLTLIRSKGCQFGEALESDTCKAALDGTVAAGSACQDDLECAGDAYCKSSGTCPGTCTASEQVGGSCQDDDQCAASLKCSELDSKCYAPPVAGAACGGSQATECAAGLFCIGSDQQAGTPGTCQPLSQITTGKEGDTCSFQTGPLCSPGVSCTIDSISGTTLVTKCTAEVASGAACKLGFPDPCPDGEYCAAPAQSFDGTCKTLPAAGQPCATGAFDQTPSLCAPYTRCEAGTCRALQTLGSTCQVDEVCLSEHCVGGKCAPEGACG